jgi:hypothetical protein
MGGTVPGTADALDIVLMLQDEGRKLQAMLRTFPLPAAETIEASKNEVLRLRETLAVALGLRKTKGGCGARY